MPSIASHASACAVPLDPRIANLPRDLLDLPEVVPPNPVEHTACFRQQLIQYPAFTTALEAIERCHQLGRQGLAEADSLLIVGVSGSGKSTVREHYAKRFPRYDLEDRTVIPVLDLQLPALPTIKNVAERILLAMGDPFADKGSAESKTARIIRLFAECRVELVILDEFQHFVERKRGTIDYKVADWLKQIINATRVPFVLMGLPECESILGVNEQLRRRFSHRIYLAPFSIKTDVAARQFIGVLKTLGAQPPFQQCSVLTDPAIVKAMYYATHGLIGYVMKLASAALEIAVRDRLDRIDLAVLARAFQDVIMPHCTKETNPFSSSFIPRPLNRKGEPFDGYL